MTRFPLLEGLRAERERLEDEINAPLHEALRQCSAHVSQLRSALRNLEEIVGSKIGQHVIDDMGHALSGEIRRQIEAAMVAAGDAPKDAVTFKMSAAALRFMDPGSVERELLNRYVNQSLPRLSLRADRGTGLHADASVTVMDIRIPELGMRRYIASADRH